MAEESNIEVGNEEGQEATVVSIEVADDPQDALYELDEIIDGVFTDYKIIHRIESDGQRFMMPVTSPDGFDGDAVAFVQLAGGTVLWIVDWTAEKVNAQPSLPDPDLGDENVVLLDKHWEPTNLLLKPSGNGAIVYRISGTYVYGLKNPNLFKMYYSRPPWMAKVPCEVTAKFKKGIITCDGDTEEVPESPNQPSNASEAALDFDITQ